MVQAFHGDFVELKVRPPSLSHLMKTTVGQTPVASVPNPCLRLALQVNLSTKLTQSAVCGNDRFNC